MIDITQELHQGADPLQNSRAYRSREDVIMIECMDSIIDIAEKYNWYAVVSSQINDNKITITASLLSNESDKIS